MASHQSSFETTNICRLLEQGYDSSLRDTCGRTLMHMAALRGDISALELLLDRGVNFSSIDNKGNTPLHLCLKPVVIQFLVKRAGVSPTARNFHGDTALILAQRLGASKDILRMLKFLEREELKVKVRHLSSDSQSQARFQQSSNVLYETWCEFVKDLGMKRLFYLLLVLSAISFLLTYKLLVVEYKPVPISVP